MTPRRTRIAEGIYADKYGLAATVKVGRIQREQRFPADHPIDDIKAWQHRTRAELHDEKPEPGEESAHRGTLRTDAAIYLKQISGRAGFKADRAHLRAWIDRFGSLPRTKIKAPQVRTALAEWRAKGLHTGGRGTWTRKATGRPASEKTLQQRWRVLKHLYKTLDGPKARTPCDDVPRPRPGASTPVGVDITIVQRVADKLRARAKGTPIRSDERKDYARYLMLATTAARPAQLMRAIAEDFKLKEQFWIVRGAKGGPTHSIYLNAEMRAAVKLFLGAGALGAYNDERLLDVARAHGWPRTMPLYNLRHSLAIDALAEGADLGDVQAMLGHTTMDMTRRAYAGIAKLRQKGVGQRLEGRIKVG